MRVYFRLLAYLGRHRGALALAALCMLLLALTSSVYAFLAGPVLRFLLSGGSAGTEPLSRIAPGLLGGVSAAQWLWVLPTLLFATGVLKGAAYFGQFYAVGMLAQRLVVELRGELVRKLLRLSPSFYSQGRTGDLLSRFSADVAAVERAATYALASYMRDPLEALVLLGLAFWLDWRLSLISFAAVPLAVVPVARLAKRLRQQMGKGQRSLGRLSAHLQDTLWGLKVVQAYGIEEQELRRFDQENQAYFAAARRAIRLSKLAPVGLELLVTAGVALSLYIASRALGGLAVAPERLFSFAAAAILLSRPLKEIGRMGTLVLQAGVAAERLFAVIDEPEPLRERPAALVLPPLRKEIRFEGVGFGYGGRAVLSELELTLRRGEVLAVVGESGAGKSTLVSLLMRFYDPSSGALLVDGVDAREASLASLRAQFALVTQEPFLFDGTVKSNIAYGRPGATREEIERAARVAQAHDFIGRLPGGYEHRVGERGGLLSGGQRQRVALARAVLSEAPVLVLDEATSNLDPESEREAQRALEAVLVGRTALVIAHRLSTVQAAHRIVVLKEGRIAESGTHESLIAGGGEYQRLYEAQSGSGAPARAAGGRA